MFQKYTVRPFSSLSTLGDMPILKFCKNLWFSLHSVLYLNRNAWSCEYIQLFICSVAEYCSVVITSLIEQQRRKIEVIQKASLEIILGCEYKDFKSAMMKFSICSLDERRSERAKLFALRCVNACKTISWIFLKVISISY